MTVDVCVWDNVGISDKVGSMERSFVEMPLGKKEEFFDGCVLETFDGCAVGTSEGLSLLSFDGELEDNKDG